MADKIKPNLTLATILAEAKEVANLPKYEEPFGRLQCSVEQVRSFVDAMEVRLMSLEDFVLQISESGSSHSAEDAKYVFRKLIDGMVSELGAREVIWSKRIPRSASTLS